MLQTKVRKNPRHVTIWRQVSETLGDWDLVVDIEGRTKEIAAEWGTKIQQVPAMLHFLRRIAEGREYVRGYETGLALDELQADARAILRAVEGEK